MIPKPFSTPELEAVSAFVDAQPPHVLVGYQPPTVQDLATFGAVIQTFNYVELNLRRALAAFEAGGVLPSALRSKLARLSGQALIEAVSDTAEAIHAASGQDGEAGAHLQALHAQQPMRNLLAHWAARRVPDRDFLVFISKDDRDAKQALGAGLEGDVIARCVVHASALTGLIDFLRPHELWVAHKVTVWHARYLGGGA